MPYTLVILESPGKINAVKNYLGSNYKVIASIGHVRDLPKSDLGIDIDNGFTPHYINIRGKGDVIKEIKNEAKKANKILFATDPDREGEAISWHLSAILGEEAIKSKRISFNEITKNAVKEAIKHPRDIDIDLVNSQQARRILDRIVGYKISPILWKTVKSGLSAGRVQSVATKIIVEKEKEIESFVKKEYWTISANLLSSDKEEFAAHFYGSESGKVLLSSKEESEKIIDSVNNRPFSVKSIKKGTKIKSPAPPFTTSTLQQEASRKYNFQSQKTMKIAQELYEGINVGSEHGGIQGLITYMRTDSLRISAEAQENAKDYIIKKYGEDYYPSKPRIYKSKQNVQDAHEAVRPSKLSLAPNEIKRFLTNDQYKLYKLIWDRFLSSQMSSAIINTVVADIECNGYIFKSSGYSVKFSGYKEIYQESSDEVRKSADDDFNPEKNNVIPMLKEGETLKQISVEKNQHFTEPPYRYDEATLIKFLEEKGIGRPSTYTPIITLILSRGYVEREGKWLKPSSLGKVTTEIMEKFFPDIVNYRFTANMENNLDNIERGKTTAQEVLGDFYVKFEKELLTAEQSLKKEDIEIPVEEADMTCDLCGSNMIIKTGKYGKFAACPNFPKCRFTKALNDNKSTSKEETKINKTGIKCEICGADMVIRKSKYGEFYACENYPKCNNTKPISGKTDIKCPLCGSDIILKYTKAKKPFYSCSQYPKCNFSSWDIPTDRKCPICNDILLKKKDKDYLYCHNEKCRYKTGINNDEQ